MPTADGGLSRPSLLFAGDADWGGRARAFGGWRGVGISSPLPGDFGASAPLLLEVFGAGCLLLLRLGTGRHQWELALPARTADWNCRLPPCGADFLFLRVLYDVRIERTDRSLAIVFAMYCYSFFPPRLKDTRVGNSLFLHDINSWSLLGWGLFLRACASGHGPFVITNRDCG